MLGQDQLAQLAAEVRDQGHVDQPGQGRNGSLPAIKTDPVSSPIRVIARARTQVIMPHGGLSGALGHQFAGAVEPAVAEAGYAW